MKPKKPREEKRPAPRPVNRLVDVGIYQDEEGRYRLSYRLDATPLWARLKASVEEVVASVASVPLWPISKKKEEE